MSAVLNNKGFVLTLYRNILKEHKKKLPSTMRHLGDEYVKNEFRLHKVGFHLISFCVAISLFLIPSLSSLHLQAAKEEQVKAFVHAWTDYLTVMRRKEDTFGTNLGSEDLNALGE